ncbi:MAG TPA: DinB family protein [Gemmatimonadales bacterium]|nr:DinB family protein [Gemmatimonadales bacterium]
MLLPAVGAVLDRDLRALRREVEAYPEDRAVWQQVPGISNVAGTLVLHLTGNLQHYLGARLGGTDFIRNRAAEFSRRDVPRAELVREIEAARAAVKTAVARIAAPELAAEFPETVGGVRVVTGEYLIHLATHFAYHLGQVDYHRRMVTGSPATVDAMRPAELASARLADG